MISRCAGDSCVRHCRRTAMSSCFCRITSALSALSGISAMISSSSGSLVRRRSADIALWRAIANSQVETDEPLELRGVAPDVEKHVTQEVFGQGLVAYETQQPAV